MSLVELEILKSEQKALIQDLENYNISYESIERKRFDGGED